MVQRSLYEMIGVSADADRQDIRYAYEQAMRTATRGGDHRRAVALSTAFDALDPRTRRDIFPSARSGPGSARGEHTASLNPSDYDLGPMPSLGVRPGRGRGRSGRRTGDHSRAWGRRLLAAAVAAGVILLVGSYVWRTQIPHSPSVPARYRQPDPQPTVQVSAAANQLVVPDDAPVGATGTVTVACSGAGGSYDLTAFPGDTVSCGNGATPQLITSG